MSAELIAEARTPVYASTSDEAWGRGGVSPADRDGLVERLADTLEAAEAKIHAQAGGRVMPIDYRNNAAERIVQALKNPDEMQAQTVALIAQAEATLALVEQQRIANLIALEDQRWARVSERGNYWGPDVLRGNPATPDAFPDLHPEIREGLGL